MNSTEALALLRKVIALCPSQAMDEYTPEAWAEVLDDIRWEDANQALINIGKADLDLDKRRYIEPGHIRGEVRRIRARRLSVYGPIEPPPTPWPADANPWGDDLFGVAHNMIEERYMAEMRVKVANGELAPGETIPVPVVSDEEINAKLKKIHDKIDANEERWRKENTRETPALPKGTR